MSRRGNCWNNAVAESFFVSLKKDRIKKRIYKTRQLAAEDISDYIGYPEYSVGSMTTPRVTCNL